MADSITVNGVVFSLASRLLASGREFWFNGRTFLLMDEGAWKASVHKEPGTDGIIHGPWCNTPEDALTQLYRQAQEWAPVLSELARLGIWGGK